ncbi:hypothetical protein E3E12_01460 [Formicincola oecophyllae]|uniref:DUF308 domain-containing protein n=1 Tax=Formicincola oecophyllae TaxID=2558361 RepID=A0A4Y6U7D8_9PROT|nr:hypothetical protein [Formicincola oecophyllae]QDH13084.1 hypothetical protein E3E12_01460 [Formicincola oecophyllae]
MVSSTPSKARTAWPRTVGVLLILGGLALIGCELLHQGLTSMLPGFILGAGLILCGLMTATRSPASLPFYGLWLLVTLGVIGGLGGLMGIASSPVLALGILVGLLLCLPPLSRHLQANWVALGILLASSSLALAVMGFALMQPGAHPPAMPPHLRIPTKAVLEQGQPSTVPSEAEAPQVGGQTLEVAPEPAKTQVTPLQAPTAPPAHVTQAPTNLAPALPAGSKH